ncbi:hypothetical protein PROAA_20053 [Candidatus Propionivibrio aalborgensis]|uniref:Uncharacterized protein n=1 Tax=Candidatus Propionivibrio aalborgensis TaxID=1860101 RepID=A0A1A8XQI4_9RHOO|nr:hypothetical protein PROAA_20053 [Candidatus Propionivibrio aalborgensis]
MEASAKLLRKMHQHQERGSSCQHESALLGDEVYPLCPPKFLFSLQHPEEAQPVVLIVRQDVILVPDGRLGGMGRVRL